MAISNFGLPFSANRSMKQDLRPRPSKFALSDIRSWRFEQSEGIRPAAYYGVNKYLPVQLWDISTTDYIVIPKGRIVSALSAEDSIPVSGMVYPAASGSRNIGFKAPEVGGGLLTAKIDDDFFGYDMHINALLVPCNGGVQCTGFYTADDVTAQTINPTGAYAVASGSFITPACAPVGVAFHDWYQDIAGKWLNYRMHVDGGHVLTDWYVEMPFVKVDGGAGSPYAGVQPSFSNGDYANLLKWRLVNKAFTYLQVGASDVFRNGVFVSSDLIGNYQIQWGANSMSTLPTVAPHTAQTVGKILEIDSRWPKDGLEDVQTYPRSGMPGTQTAGMPKFLFDFVYDCITIGTGIAPTVEQIYTAIRSGAFGIVRIQLLVS